ncbi:MAG: ImmA/IrrE family metallo-endopeptidase [Candidatus Hatepunaea meridiana]|nr:ImmA/IrrE family metallo-endopeptidase [Candidatus Hatepunaea meridiana]
MVRRSIAPAPYKPPIAIIPGKTLKRIINSRGISQRKLAQRMGRPNQEISYLINGKRTITLETAERLEYVLGIKASFWLNIEKDYQETKARLEEESRLSEQAQKIKNFPYAEMVNFGLVEATRKPLERVKNLLSFFQVANFDALESHIQSIIGENLFSKSDGHKLSQYKLAVWLRMGEIEAEDLELLRFNAQRLRHKLPDIRALTLGEPEYFIPELKKIGSECGVAFLFIRGLKGFPVWGLTRWVGNNPYIQVNIRYKTNNHLWFAIFHEIGHVLLHKRGDFFINIENRKDDNNPEDEADIFARDMLIPVDAYGQLTEGVYICEEEASVC